MTIKRRDFLTGAGGVLAASAAIASKADAAGAGTESVCGAETAPTGQESVTPVGDCRPGRAFNSSYRGEHLNQIAFPMGGIGAGMICLEGNGALSKFSLRNRPDLATQHYAFAAVSIKGTNTARVLEGPVPRSRIRPDAPGMEMAAIPGSSWGLPRFRQATFEARFPFATVQLADDDLPLEVKIMGWSPFSSGDADNASLPVAGVEYRFLNRSTSVVDAVFSFNAENLMSAKPPSFGDPNAISSDRVRATERGFILSEAGATDRPWDDGYLAIWTDDPATRVNHLWFRAGLSKHLSRTLVWRDIEAGACYARDPSPDDSSPGASLFVPLTLAPGQAKTIMLRLAWYVPKSDLFQPDSVFKEGRWTPLKQAPAGTYRPWYAGRFSAVSEVIAYWETHYQPLKEAAGKFSRALFASSLPPEVMEAVAANLSTLKSPTVLRQTDGRLWGWEGSADSWGTGGYGSATHVWNYAQALPHLFPDLERSLRETEFGINQDAQGHQYCRTPLPIRPLEKDTFPPSTQDAADGQLGGIIKFYRDWRISGDTDWLRRWWPRVRASLDYCIDTWDPRRRGWIEEVHLTTYDERLWGPDSLCASLYLGALKAALLMGEVLNEPVRAYGTLLKRGVLRMESELFNGEFFFQKIDWKTLRHPFPQGEDVWEKAKAGHGSPEALDLVAREGPGGQYGPGCLADGVLGVWMCHLAGVADILDAGKVASHVVAVHRHNFKKDLTDNTNVFRAVYALGTESGMRLCTWPRGGEPILPMTYAGEVWSGVEYQVASHLIMLGRIEEGLEIVRAARRRYDGRVRNPFAEIEAGHWYAREMSSYALLQAFSGARYDAVDKVLYLRPAVKGDFRCFLSTATGYGTVGVKDGKPFVEVVSGDIPYKQIEYTAAQFSG